MRHIYRVSADHVAADYRAASKPVLVAEDSDGTFFATASPYGCGKSAATAEDAIRSLLSDNACDNIKITGPFKSGPWLSAKDLT